MLLALQHPTAGRARGLGLDAAAESVEVHRRTVFLSSHDLDEVQRTAGRIAIIKDGRLIVEDTMESPRWP
jgi:ABC-2 type transport system ATP-binding protein